MKGLIPFLALIVAYGAVANNNRQDGPGCPEPLNLSPEVEERVMEAFSLGLTVIHCRPNGCFDMATGEEFFFEGNPDMNNTLYFVNLEKRNEQ